MARTRLAAAVAMVIGGAAAAQDTDLAGKVAIELNAVQTGPSECTLSFLITNGHDQAIDQLVFETVLFDAAGQVDRLTLFDFGALPVARPRVRQFAVPDVTCEGLSRVLFNGLHSCQAEGLDETACAGAVVPSSRTDIEVLG